jgi:hypothetical protein
LNGYRQIERQTNALPAEPHSRLNFLIRCDPGDLVHQST